MDSLSKRLRWKDRHGIGDEALDAQHKQLLDIANELQCALHDGKADEVLNEHLNHLISFTQLHFREEEQSMRDHHYPGFSQHKAEHDRLILQVADLQEQMSRGQKMYSMDVIYFLKHWMMHHVVTEDDAFGLHLKKHNI